MNIILHYPNEDRDLEELEKTTAKIHMEAILAYLNHTDLSADLKIKLIEWIEANVLRGNIDPK